MIEMTFKKVFEDCETDYILDLLKYNCGRLVTELKKPLTPPTKAGTPSKRAHKGHRTTTSHRDALALVLVLTEILSDRFNAEQ